MRNWKKFFTIPRVLRTTEREYRANIEGMNIVFGAVLGFVLAGTESMATKDFMLILLLSATVVVMILYLGSSEYRLFYGVTAVIGVLALPWALQEILEVPPVPKLQPTLGSWLLMVILIELMPRVREMPATRDS